MNTEHHQKEIDQIRKHVRMLNVAGGVAIGALTIAGMLFVFDVFESKPSEVISEAVTEQVAGEDTSLADIETTYPDEEKEEIVSTASKPGAANSEILPTESSKKLKTESKKDAITFEEELHSFEASCNNGSILFHWVTSGGTKYAYEIEKTYDHVNFEVFSRAPQPEKMGGKNTYQVEETATTNDDAYYRLRKVVGKGKYEYSEAVKVSCSGANERPATVDVFPNGNGAFRILINSPKEENYKVTLSDVNENLMATEVYLAKAGDNEFVLSSANIVRGNYVLRVSSDSMVKEKKVVLK